MKTRLLITVAVAACVASLGTAAYCQEPTGEFPTNLRGMTTTAAPPDGFDYSMVSDADLAMYGLPPRPNEFAEPVAYAAWKKAMAASKQRIVPQLRQTNRFHGPYRAVANSSETSSNWSGVVNQSGAQAYNQSTSFHYVFAEWVVPVATQAYGVCTGGWDYSSSWIGIDGWGSKDVLQAGTASDAYCGSGGSATYYGAWVEWYPYGAIEIRNFPAAPGDDVYVAVWNTSSTQGHVYFANYTTNQAVEASLVAPPGTYLVGNTAEWVVERPEVNSGLTTLTNYVADFFTSCTATTWSGITDEPGGPGATLLTMVDANSKPISAPIVMGRYGIWFQTEGSAR